jgi:hypothetical protein
VHSSSVDGSGMAAHAVMLLVFCCDLPDFFSLSAILGVLQPTEVVLLLFCHLSTSYWQVRRSIMAACLHLGCTDVITHIDAFLLFDFLLVGIPSCY